MYPCHNTGGNQEWSYESGLIRHHNLCLSASLEDQVTVLLVVCDPADDSQLWKRRGLTFTHSKLGDCLDSSKSNLLVDICDPNKSSQLFTF